MKPQSTEKTTAAGGKIPAPPPSEKRPVTETLHGMELVDPFRWLEGDDQGKTTPAVESWTLAQNAFTRSVLDHLPGRIDLEKRLRPLLEIVSISTPHAAGNRYFFGKREGTQNQPVIYVREGVFGQAKALIDPNTAHAKGLMAIQSILPSHDGHLLAYCPHFSGDENTSIRILDVDSGQSLPDEITGKAAISSWLPDGRGFLYSKRRDIDNPYSRQIRFHWLGADPEEDPVLFEQYTEGPLATTWGPGAHLSHNGRWLFLSYFTSTRSNDVWVVDFHHWLKTGEFIRQAILVGKDAENRPSSHGDTLFLWTTLDAPQGRIIEIDLLDPRPENWTDRVPARTGLTIVDVELGNGFMAITCLKNAANTIEIINLTNHDTHLLSLPGIGSASIVTMEDRTEAFVSFQSFNHPPAIFRTDLGTGVLEPWEIPDVPVDPSSVEVSQVWFPSRDGTQISAFLIHQKGLKRDGNHPALLYGYGGFNQSMSPSFVGTRFPWFEDGGVLMVVNLRGGGEYGDEWHRAGMLEKKQHVFDDFIAAAEWLIAEKYTCSSRLVIMGGSNGGLLTGAVLTQRPELFAAVICAVPLLDMIRYHRFLMARYWVPEYGSAEDPDQFKFLLDYSPYQNVIDGTRYPAVFLTAGEHDSRVHPLHARKMAARLREATASSFDEHPILLWVDLESGHGQGKPLSLRLQETVDQQIFIRRQTGMLPVTTS
jgi:prolyl oligopeptidase